MASVVIANPIGDQRSYLPDYIVRVDDGRGPGDRLNMIVEVTTSTTTISA